MKRRIKNDFAFSSLTEVAEEGKEKEKQKKAKRWAEYIAMHFPHLDGSREQGPRRRGQVSGSATLPKWAEQEKRKLQAHASL
jgi:hypothetical protein